MFAVRHALVALTLAALVASAACAPAAAPAAAPASAPAPAAQAKPQSAPAAPAAPAATPPAPVTLNYGMTGPQAVYWATFVALEKGFWAAEGINLEVFYTDTSIRNVTALVGGSLDVAGTSPDVIINAVEKGADLVIVAEEISKPVYAIVAAPNIPNVPALRGQKVAHSGLRAGTTWMLLKTLAHHGIQEADIEMVQTGGTSARYAALKSGAVAAAAMLQPDDFRIMDEGFGRIAMSTDAIQEFTFNTINVRRDWARQHDGELVRLVRGFRRAMDWLLDPANKEEALVVLVERTKQEEKYARLTYDLSLVQERMFAEQGRVRPSGLQAVLEQLADSGEVSRPIPRPEKYIDNTYWERAGAR